MKTLQELFKEIATSDELKKAFAEAGSNKTIDAFLKEHDCDATKAELVAFLTEKAGEDKPLSIDQLEQAAGGFWSTLWSAVLYTVDPVKCVAD